MNFVAYSHLIPVVGGGIKIRVHEKTQKLRHADSRAHIATPTRRCLECIEQYNPGYVSAERDGYFDDPSYIEGLPKDHPLKHNENVFAFSLSAASFKILQFLSMIVAPSGLSNPGMYHFMTAALERDEREECDDNCLYPQLIAKGDKANIKVTGHHAKAEQARHGRTHVMPNWKYRLKQWLYTLIQCLPN